jgi:hypothetical protein
LVELLGVGEQYPVISEIESVTTSVTGLKKGMEDQIRVMERLYSKYKRQQVLVVGENCH